MPKILCQKIKPNSDEGQWEITDNQYGLSKKTFSIEYDILGDNIDQNEDDIKATPGLPALWTFLRGCYCNNLSVAEVNSHAFLWKATAEFDSDVNPEEQDNEDPTNAQPQWSWTHETEQMNLEEDVNGKALQTVTHEKYFVDVPVAIPVLTISRYELSFDPQTILDYVNHVNETPFWGIPKGDALMAGISDHQETVGDTNYRKVEYVVKVRLDYLSGQLIEDGWQLRLLHHGQWQLIAPFLSIGRYDPENLLRFTDQDGRAVTGNLAADGRKLGQDDPLVYLKFDQYREAEFNDLNLGPWP